MERITGTVKWFNTRKDFGFLTVDDGQGDVMLPGSRLREAGKSPPPPGATVTCDVVQGKRGRQAAAVVHIDTGTATAPRVPFGVMPAGDFEGTVKWYNGTRGYGFVERPGEVDVFIHAEVVKAAGLGILQTGDRVCGQCGRGEKGLVAMTVKLVEEAAA